ncbi:MAG: class I SAM-dependent methyltransferase, partial [Alphaproteobacteria bacterium]
RPGTLIERRWLDRALAHAPGRRVLDLGCGAGRPLGQYLAERRCRMSGVDAADAMATLYAATVPEAEAWHADMRELDLGARFDLLLAWDSLGHLPPEDQRAVFSVFAAHAAPRAALLFTSPHRAGVGARRMAGVPVYWAGIGAEETAAALAAAGFSLLVHAPAEAAAGGDDIWLARFTNAG